MLKFSLIAKQHFELVVGQTGKTHSSVGLEIENFHFDPSLANHLSYLQKFKIDSLTHKLVY